MNHMPSYTPTPAEIARMKEKIFRENMANGTVRIEPVSKGRFRGVGIHKRKKPYHKTAHKADGIRRAGRQGR